MFAGLQINYLIGGSIMYLDMNATIKDIAAHMLSPSSKKSSLKSKNKYKYKRCERTRRKDK
jgi:hypothetical protein